MPRDGESTCHNGQQPVLVSCIMPTYNRPHFLPQAIKYFLEQDYAQKELIIVDDGVLPAAPVLPEAEEITYVRLPDRTSLGAKRNHAIALSRGQVIMHWDDDDWMARSRIRYQVECLLASDCQITGLNRMLFYDTRCRRLWLYEYASSRRPWLAGGSLCYWKSAWDEKKFRDITAGEDTQFVWSAPQFSMLSVPEFTFYVALIHSGNTCAKSLSGPCWSPWLERDFRDVVGSDWDTYRELFGWRVQ